MKRITASLAILALVGLFAVVMPQSVMAQSSQMGKMTTTDQTALSNQFKQLSDNNKMISRDIDKLRVQADKMKAEKDQTKLQTELQDYQTLWAQVQQRISENQKVFNQTYSSITGQQPMTPQGMMNDHGSMDHNGMMDHGQSGAKTNPNNNVDTSGTNKSGGSNGY